MQLGSPTAQLVKNLPAMQETPVRFLSQKDCWRRDGLPTPVFLGFPGGSAGKESTWNARDLGSIPGLRRSPGEGKGYPLQYSGLENTTDWIVHGVTKSQTQLSNFHFYFSYTGKRGLWPTVTGMLLVLMKIQILKRQKLQWLYAAHTLQTDLEFYGELYFKILINAAQKVLFNNT